MSTTRVKFLKSAAGPHLSAAAGDFKSVPTDLVAGLLEAGAIVVPAAPAPKSKPLAAPEPPTPEPEPETTQSPAAPENATLSPNPKRGRRGARG